MNITLVPGVLETTLDAVAMAALPDTAPPAPWRCRCDAVVWLARPNRSARAVLAPGVAETGRPVAVVGGFVRYRDTPVGSYDEVLGAVALAGRHGIRASVPFMAVDSAISVVGGRSNWSLPKTLAEFTGDPASGVRAGAPGWSVRAQAHAAPRGLSIRATGRLIQQWPDGEVRRSVLRTQGLAVAALVRVETHSDNAADGLPDWLRPGWHLGAVILDADFTLGRPRG
jgi:hypothetical protein